MDTEISNEEEIVNIAVVKVMGENDRGNLEEDELKKELNNQIGKDGKIEVSKNGEEFEVLFIESERYYIIDNDGNVSRLVEEENTAETPKYWEKTTKNDDEWYSYADISNGNKEVKVNAPKLRGAMTAIKYVGEDAESQTGSKWANAITADGNMWVWIPRYAYKITSGYHEKGTEATGGTIEVAFIDTDNNFLNGETGRIVTDPSEVTYTENVQNEWLVHPAFTSNAENGGGFGEITGIWVGKFETTGSYDSTTNTRIITILPGKKNEMGTMTINQQYKLAKNATFEENFTMNSHMAKNSEWGAVAYLTQSKYGVDGQKINRNGNGTSTGGGGNEKTVYTTNKTQSTTYNAYGIYDMSGGNYENVAAYINCTMSQNNLEGGGYGEEDSLLGKNENEKATSTAYKTVYKEEYKMTENMKGDAIWETSLVNSNYGSWFGGVSTFPKSMFPYFWRGENYFLPNGNGVSIFSYRNDMNTTGAGFRIILAF